MLQQLFTEPSTRLSDQLLLDNIKARLASLEKLYMPFERMYEDGIYRFYHHSFKVYSLQNLTLAAHDLFQQIANASETQLNSWFEEIITDGTGAKWEAEHNQAWPQHTRPIVEAFLHSKYFLQMMIRYASELDFAPSLMPTGWAAILELYGLR